MCGILGTINQTLDINTLNLLAHRGPDESGLMTWQDLGQQICFGHRRLSIVDLTSTGSQPMFSASGDSRITFNGEIYNHNELRKTLPDIAFRGTSDTETLINGLEQFGPHFINSLNGIFAFCWFDARSHALYLARDRFGVKPLYYWHEGSSLIFSSEVKPICRLLGGANVNPRAISDFLALRYVPSPDTMFSGIRKLRPGDVLRYALNDGSLTLTAQLNNLCNVHVVRNRGEAYWVDALSEKLESAVQRQLMSDVPVGTFLSGGLDSALITAIASRHVSAPIKTFCVGFKNAKPEDDELAEARFSSNWIGTEHRDIIVDPDDYLKFLRLSTYFLDEPNGTAATMAQYKVSELAAQHVKVCLAGQGADEIFLGYPRYRAERLQNRLGFAACMFRLRLDWLVPRKFHMVHRALRSFSVVDDLHRFVEIFRVFSEQQIRELLITTEPAVKLSDPAKTLDFFFRQIPSDLEGACKMSLLDTFTWLPDELLIYGDKMTMAHSLEMRVPFLDNELVALVQKMPVEFKLRNGRGKHILRQVARRYLPDEIIRRPKKGFVMPILSWFQNELNAPLREKLVNSDAFIHRFVKRDKIRELLDAYLERSESDYRKLLLLLHLEEWGRVHVIGEKPDQALDALVTVFH